MTTALRVLALISSASPLASIALAQPVPPSPEATTARVGDTLDEIIVTAQRRVQNVQEIAGSVSALQGDALQAAAAFETQDLAKLVPSLTIISSQGGTQPGFTLRGVGRANQFEPYQTPPVSVYVDEVYQSSPTTHGTQLYDLERIEVLRGPQGTLYGKNTTGGAINYITRKPGLDGHEGYASAGYGNYNSFTAEAALELTPVDGALGVRAAVDYIKSDGWTKNIAPGDNNLNGLDAISTRLTVRWKTGDLDLTLRGYYSRNNDDTPGVLIAGTDPDGSYSFAGGLLRYSRAGLEFNEVDIPGPQRKFFHDNRGVDLNAVWSASDDLILTSISSWSRGRIDYAQEVDGTPLDILSNTQRGRYRQWSQELRAQYTGLEGLDVVVGGFFGADRNRYAREDRILFALPIVSDPLNGVPPLGGNVSFTQKRDSAAVFAHVIYALKDRLKTTIGMRYTHDKSRIFDINAFLRLRVAPGGSIVPAVNTVPSFGPFDPTQVDPGLRNTEDEVTGTAALAYEIGDDVNAYASYSRGYRAGANNAGTLSTAQIQYLDPERVDAFEVGLKSELLDRRLRINAAAFYYDYSNLIVQEFIGPQAFLASAGPAEIYGVDIEATAVVAEGLRLASSLGLLRARYSGDGALFAGSVEGNRLPFAPEVTWRSSVDWDVIKTDALGVWLHADANYTGSFFFQATNEDVFAATGTDSRGLRQDGFWLVDASAGLRLPRQKLEFSVWIKNVFDKDYFVYGLELRRDLGFASFVTGAPRTFGGTATLRF